MNKPMTAQKIRTMAGRMLAKADEKADHAKTAELALAYARKHGAFKHGDKVFTVEEMEGYARIAKDQADEWAILRGWAKQLQEHSFTMKG